MGATSASNQETSRELQAGRRTFRDQLRMYRNDPVSGLIALCIYGATGVTVATLFFILGFIFVRGVPYLTPSLFAWEYNSSNVSMTPALINTLSMTLLALVISVPFGVFSAIYLVEYAKRGSWLVRLIRMTAETLSGIPSIIYGLFGLLFFVSYLGWGYSLLAGGCTLAIMILPLVMRTTEEALLAVPDSYREGSYGLGAGRMRTIFVIVLPAAVPGILAGVVLSIGRIVGETAALLYTSGSVAAIPQDLLSSGRTLAVHMYALTQEGLYVNQAYATAVVLIVLVLVLNLVSSLIAKRLTKG